MSYLRSHLKPLCRIIAASLLFSSVYVPAVQADIVGTGAMIQSAEAEQNRTHLQSLLARTDVKEELQAMGVSMDQVQARVDSMTDTEVLAVVDRIDELPAGASLGGALVVIFIVLIITDALGITDVFTFVKSRR